MLAPLRSDGAVSARPPAPPLPLPCSAGELSAEELESIMTIVANPRAYKIPDWFLNRQKDVKDGRYSQVGRGGAEQVEAGRGAGRAWPAAPAGRASPQLCRELRTVQAGLAGACCSNRSSRSRVQPRSRVGRSVPFLAYAPRRESWQGSRRRSPRAHTPDTQHRGWLAGSRCHSSSGRPAAGRQA